MSVTLIKLDEQVKLELIPWLYRSNWWFNR